MRTEVCEEGGLGSHSPPLAEPSTWQETSRFLFPLSLGSTYKSCPSGYRPQGAACF